MEVHDWPQLAKQAATLCAALHYPTSSDTLTNVSDILEEASQTTLETSELLDSKLKSLELYPKIDRVVGHAIEALVIKNSSYISAERLWALMAFGVAARMMERFVLIDENSLLLLLSATDPAAVLQIAQNVKKGDPWDQDTPSTTGSSKNPV